MLKPINRHMHHALFEVINLQKPQQNMNFAAFVFRLGPTVQFKMTSICIRFVSKNYRKCSSRPYKVVAQRQLKEKFKTPGSAT